MQIPMNKQGVATLIVSLIAMPMLAACGGKYYEVSQAGGGKTYNTRDIDHDDGRLRFRDEVTGDKVRLDNTEVKEITRQEYKNATGK